MTVLKLVSKSSNGAHWGPKDVLETALQDVAKGEIGLEDRLIVVSVNPRGKGEFNTRFIQCGMSASEMIMLLEIAKMDIYKKHMASTREPE